MSERKNNPLAFTPSTIRPDFSKRRVINQLPLIHQTNTLTKFFAATADHLFDPGQSTSVNGYIGGKPGYFNKEKDFYIVEQDNTRQNYQLEPGMTTINDGELTTLLYYQDLINHLRFQGALTNNHNRLFEQEFYSWCPPINLDMFINFRKYYWVPEGPPPVEIVGPCAEYIGDGITRRFNFVQPTGLNAPLIPISSETIKVKVDDIAVTFTWNTGDDFIILTNAPPINAKINIWLNTDFYTNVIGKQYTEGYDFFNGPQLSSGMRIKITNDINPIFNDKIFIVEGVGQKIQLLPDDEGMEPDTPVEYYTMERGCQDGNPWSLYNRWFHQDQLNGAMNAIKARRPIIEYIKNIELYNYGRFRRLDVNLVDTQLTDIVGAFSSRTHGSAPVDGVNVTVEWIRSLPSQTARILSTKDANPQLTNRIYILRVINDLIQISMEADGLDTSGYPTEGEIVYVRNGVTYSGKELYWNGMEWTVSQTKTSVLQKPLFQLYDSQQNKLNDLGIYPNSNFTGNTLFSYKESLEGKTDKYLGIKLSYNKNGDIVFVNNMTVDRYIYQTNGNSKDIDGYYWFSIVEGNNKTYDNSWYPVVYKNTNVIKKSRQYIVDKFTAKDNHKLFSLSQKPLDTTEENLIVYVNNNKKQYLVDFLVQNNEILFNNITDGDYIEIRTYSDVTQNDSTNGYFEIPQNLQCNPLNEDVDEVSLGKVYEQFCEIMSSQNGFRGNVYDSNNWKDTPRERNRGKQILQHSAPLLKLILHCSRRNLDIPTAIRFAEQEYNRFRSKFEQKITEFIQQNRFTIQTPISTWVENALIELNRGKTMDFPFAFSGMAIIEDSVIKHTFIPPTPSWLGMYPLYRPHKFYDTTLRDPQWMIQCHDGSIVPAFGEYDIRDNITLELESRIYRSADDRFKNEYRPIVDYKKYVSNGWVELEYSNYEFKQFLRGNFEKWAAIAQRNYKENTIWDINDPWTWNWNSCVDKNGTLLPGHWRAIYELYYDTDRPHTHPWEMLGFSTMPDWWAYRYGVAPYTSENTIMWEDIRLGRILEGNREGLHTEWSRGLDFKIPVDDQGKLLPPNLIGLTDTIPNISDLKRDWNWGDGGPIERIWRRSSSYPFAVALATYLMKPLLWVEYNWDITNVEFAMKGYDNEQIIDKTTGKRNSPKQLYVHGEIKNNEYIKNIGFQQWISDWLLSKNQNIHDNYGIYIRGLNAQLCYKVAGFTDTNNISVISDSFDKIPQEDINIVLYRSPSVQEEFYGGVIIEWTGRTWKVFGYDILNPQFTILPADTNGERTTVSISEKPIYEIPDWRSNTYYNVNVTVKRVNTYYRCIKTHTSSRIFEEIYWVEVARPQAADPDAVVVYTKYLQDPQYIQYGEEFNSKQEVADFLIGWGHYLEDRGWVFDYVDTEQNVVNNWTQSLKEFLVWSQFNWEPGNFISLSPGAEQLRFVAKNKTIQPIDDIVNGVHGLLDKRGTPVNLRLLNVMRSDHTITVSAKNKNDGLYSCRIYLSEIEHGIVLNNTTIFNDTIYDPLFGIKQTRLRLQGYKTGNWQGRIDAPGYIMSGDTIRPNFEKSANDFRYYFEIEGIENTDLRDRARHNIGYQERSYLSELLLTPTNQFEFYQGMIQHKGTHTAMKKLLRSNFIQQGSNVQFLEEWGFKVGEFGAQGNNLETSFHIRQQDIQTSPQLFEIKTTYTNDIVSDKFTVVDGIQTIHNNYQMIELNLNILGLATINVVTPGSRYQRTPNVIIQGGGGAGARADAIINWSGSHIEYISITNGGSGYMPGDMVIINGRGENAGHTLRHNDINWLFSQVESIYVVESQSGFNIGDNIIISGGNQSARAHVSRIDSIGRILDIEITQRGSGYDENATAYVQGNQTGAQLRVIVSGGSIIQGRLYLDSGGSGYDENTTVTFVGHGSGAVGAVKIYGGFLDRIQITNHGTGYTSIPNIDIEGGTPATTGGAVATLDTTPFRTEYTLMELTDFNLVKIEDITVEVRNEFSGTQPIITIGDQHNTSSYLHNVSLAQKTVLTFKINTENNTDQIKLFVRNIHNRGNAKIRIRYNLTDKHYNQYVENQKRTQINTLVDIFHGDDTWALRNSRWVWRHQTKDLEWPTKHYNGELEHLPNAGYVHLDDIQWYAVKWNDFISRFYDAQVENPHESIVKTITIGRNSNSFVENIISTRQYGRMRIRKITVSVGRPFLTTHNANITIGSRTNPTLWATENTFSLSRSSIQNKYIFEIIDHIPNIDNGIYVYFNTQDTNILGEVSITVDAEIFNNSVNIDQRCWVYDTGIGHWDVYTLKDTSLNSSFVIPPSSSETDQGTIVTTDRDIFTTQSWLSWASKYGDTSETRSAYADWFSRKLVIIDGCEINGYTFDSIYHPVIRNQLRIDFVEGANVLGGIRTQIMDLLTNTGIVLESVTVNVLQPFQNSTQPYISIGNATDAERYMSRYSTYSVDPTEYNPPAPTPYFNYGQPINVSIWNPNILVNESTISVPIQVVRSGNIYLTPSSITVTNPGSGYTSSPNITVTGPEGVTAVATMSGPIVEILVTNGGSGYTTPPQITILGGGDNAQGAAAVAIIQDGAVVSIQITTAGTGYSVEPRIVFSGGNGTGATATARINLGVESIRLTSIGRCNYNGTPEATVTIDPPSNPNGTAATAQLVTTPLIPITTYVYQWKYRIAGAETWTVVGGTTDATAALTFDFSSSNSTSHWSRNLVLSLPSEVSRDTIFEIEIPLTRTDNAPNISNGAFGNRTATVTIINNRTAINSTDLTTPGTYTANLDWSPTSDDSVWVYLGSRSPNNYQPYDPNNPNQRPGIINVVVDYHYTSAFELFDLDNVPIKTMELGQGGDILEWVSSRLPTIRERDSVESLPINGWNDNNLIWADNGLEITEISENWLTTRRYDYHELVKYDGRIYRSIRGGSNTTAAIRSITEQGGISNVELTNPGTIRTNEPTCIVSEGSNAQLRIHLNPTKIQKIAILDGGEGYNIWDIVTISGGGGSNAVARITRVNQTTGAIIEMGIINSGQNYTYQPNITVQGGTRSANLTAIFYPSMIRNIEILNAGTGYTLNSNVLIADTTTTQGLWISSEWELTEEKESKWRVFKKQANNWRIHREKSYKVNSNLFESTTIYNKREKHIEQTLQLFDPYKGIIPGVIERELNYKLPYDPAYYNVDKFGTDSVVVDPNRTWGIEQVGKLWWDLSTVRYLDYEQDDDTYRAKHWGQLCPGITVDVYEWVRSPVEPKDWLLFQSENRSSTLTRNQRISGRVKDTNVWVEHLEWNPSLNRDERVYYFWVRNLESVPSIPGRNLSSAQITNMLTNIVDTNIAWFAPIDKNKFIVSGVHSYLNEYDSVLRIKWRQNHYSGDEHKQWLIIKQEDQRKSINLILWNQMKYSLLGWAEHKENVEVFGILSESISERDQRIIVLENADSFTHNGVVDINGVLFSYKYKWGNELHGMSIGLHTGIRAGTVVKQRSKQLFVDSVPAGWLSESESYGNMIRPRQSWFRKNQDRHGHITANRIARRAFVEKINEIFARKPIVDIVHDWQSIFIYNQEEPATTQYSHRYDNFQIRNEIKNAGLINPGERILIPGQTETNGFWTIWEYVPGQPTPDGSEFILVETQNTRLQQGELWDYTDWYAENWSPTDFPLYRFATKHDRDMAASTIDISLLKGTLVHVEQISSSDPRWVRYVYTANGWEEVAKQNATIKLSDMFYKETSNLYGIYDYIVDDITTRDGSKELEWLIDKLYTEILTNQERNELFFTMVNIVFTQHEEIDWVFKTSFLSMNGMKERLIQSPIAQRNHTQNIIEYVEEIKPYHVKIREIVRSLVPDMDIAHFKVTDFDRPLYFDDTLNNGLGDYRKIDPNTDLYIFENYSPWMDWHANYQKTNYNIDLYDGNWNPIRKLYTKIIFDRVSCGVCDDNINKPTIDGENVELPGNERGWAVKALPWDSGEIRSRGIDTETNYYHDVNTYQEWPPNSQYYSIQTVANLNERDLIVNPPPGLVVVVISGNSVWRYQGDTWVVFEYRYNVFNTISERDDFVRSNQQSIGNTGEAILQIGDTCYVVENEIYYIWNDSSWTELNGIRWDLTQNGGAVDRIDQYYDPVIGQKAKDRMSLISGCDFRGTILDGNTLEYGIWDMFAWDFEGGWGNEFTDFVGRDIDIEDRSFVAKELYLEPTDTNVDGVPELPVGIRDPFGNIMIVPNVYEPESILVEGNDFVQPWFDSCHPEELANIRSRNPFMLTVTQRATTSLPGTPPPGHKITNYDTRFRLFKSGLEHWEIVRLMPPNLILDQNLTPYDKTIRIKWVGVGTPPKGVLHDPYDPSDMFLNNIKFSIMNWLVTLDYDIQRGYIYNLIGVNDGRIYEELTQEEKDMINIKMASTKLPGVIWINNERITYWNISYDDTTQTYTLGTATNGVNRGTATTSKASPLRYNHVSYESDGNTTTYNLPPTSTNQTPIFVRELKYKNAGSGWVVWYWDTKQVDFDYRINYNALGQPISIEFLTTGGVNRLPGIPPTLLTNTVDWRGNTITYNATAITEMRKNIRIEVVTGDWNDFNNITHDSGTEVHDGSSQHWMPMNHVDLKNYPNCMTGSVTEHEEMYESWYNFLNRPLYT
jgi:hypothetical protein